ncbi:MAG: tetratricopeptide repeat protein [Deltaproteobacteria bacterium]|nr:tetratricopeptide repeat protein [Deltaproteobacteria bacterium]
MLSPLRLADAFKSYTYDQDKVLTPEQTIARVRERLARLDLQILQETVRIDSGRLDIPVFISILGVDAKRVVPTQKQMGKGATPVQSEASALMELVERFSFFTHVKGCPHHYGWPRELEGRALDFAYLAKSLFDTSSEAQAAAKLYEDWPLYFTPATNLTKDEAVHFPLHWFYLIEEYNGPAAGNCMEEAILQALCEVVERHVGSVISHDLIPTPLIDPESVQDPAGRELLDKFRRNGIKVWLRDFSMDTGIPTVGAIAYDPSTFPAESEIVFAAGTTTDPEKSLIRALTEIAQLAGDFHRRTSYRPTLPKYETLEEAAYLMAAGPMKPLSSLPNLAHPNLKEEIQRCLAALSHIGLDVFVVDVTHPDIGIPAVYVLIPGAHFLERTRNTDVIFHLAKVAALYAEPWDALEALDSLDEAFPERFDVNFFLGLTQSNLGQAGAALSHFQKSLELGPPAHEIPSIYVHLGECHKDLEDYPQAADCLEQAIALSPDLQEAHHLLGFCFYKLGNYQDAVHCFEKVIELDPGSAIDYANLGINLLRLGHEKEGAFVLKQALELDASLDFARRALEGVGG